MLDQFFSPRSIAIVGASSNPEKIGYAILKNLTSSGYSGSIYPVNPGSSEIMGL
ncbi:MAG: CoA-binding protein, partial [Candidatus Thermoplasmatota archaeon]|nr:CoA-binding protein [Candidatus Thermoplasmatota archaeon]